MNVTRRRIVDYPPVYVPLGLFTFALVAVLSTIWPAQHARRTDRQE